MRDCLRPENLPEDLQRWFLMDAHLRFMLQRFEASIRALEEKQEELRVTRPPFFHYKTRQLAITEEHRLAATTLSAHADADRVAETAKRLDRVLVHQFSELVRALDPPSTAEFAEMLEATRKYARANWLDEDQNDEAYPYIVEQLKKVAAPPPETPVVASVYGHDEHPKAVAANDPWAAAAD